MLTIIIPVLNASATLADSLRALQPLRQRGHELLVVDGGSRDGSVTIARQHADRVLLSGTGRALQMNAGSESASHDILLFLPVDTRLPDNADALIIAAVQQQAAHWGFFARQFAEAGWLPRLRAALGNYRAAVTGLATIEQGLFVHRHAFERVKGFDSLPFNEDIALCRKLQSLGSPVQLTTPVIRPGRR